jgi:hypothetical protein
VAINNVETDGIEIYYKNFHLYNNLMKIVKEASDLTLLCKTVLHPTIAIIKSQVEKYGSSNFPKLTREVIKKLKNLYRSCCRYNSGRK